MWQTTWSDIFPDDSVIKSRFTSLKIELIKQLISEDFSLSDSEEKISCNNVIFCFCSTRWQTVLCLLPMSPQCAAHFILFLSVRNNARTVVPPVSWRYCICSLSRTEGLNVQRRMKLYTLQKKKKKNRQKKQTNPKTFSCGFGGKHWKGNTAEQRLQECLAPVICWIMFISYSFKQVVDNLWRIILWVFSALSGYATGLCVFLLQQATGNVKAESFLCDKFDRKNSNYKI